MVLIQNLTTSFVDEDFVQKIIHKTLQDEGTNDILSIDVAFVGRGRMQALNKKYHRQNRVTDVLSFASAKQFVTPKKEGRYGGEVVICLPVVKKQAARAGVTFEKELAHMLIHGTLHLLGYEHEASPVQQQVVYGASAKDAEEMHKREEKIMSSFNL